MPADSLSVRHVFTLTADTRPGVGTKGGPQGNRNIVAVTGGSFEGERLRGQVEFGGDWLTVRADGSFRLDVRLTLRTDDGAAILMTYNGIGIVEGGAARLRTAPLFETGDERYAWLNRVQCVALGTPGAGNVTYEVYELL